MAVDQFFIRIVIVYSANDLSSKAISLLRFFYFSLKRRLLETLCYIPSLQNHVLYFRAIFLKFEVITPVVHCPKWERGYIQKISETSYEITNRIVSRTREGERYKDTTVYQTVF